MHPCITVATVFLVSIFQMAIVSPMYNLGIKDYSFLGLSPRDSADIKQSRNLLTAKLITLHQGSKTTDIYKILSEKRVEFKYIKSSQSSITRKRPDVFLKANFRTLTSTNDVRIGNKHKKSLQSLVITEMQIKAT